jgi:hypothetical protein
MAELVKSMEELRRFRPSTPQESTEYVNGGIAALQKAPQRLLKVEQDKNSYAWQLAKLVLSDIRGPAAGAIASATAGET